MPWDELMVQEGVVAHDSSNQRASYWDLLQGQPLGVEASGVIAPKPPSQYTIVGQPVTRLDLNAKVQGQASFVQDMEMTAMMHARIVAAPTLNPFAPAAIQQSCKSCQRQPTSWKMVSSWRC